MYVYTCINTRAIHLERQSERDRARGREREREREKRKERVRERVCMRRKGAVIVMQEKERQR